MTAEQLMRARYSAFALGEVGFLTSSLHPAHRSDHDEEATRRWSESAEWLSLEILDAQQGGSEDTQGQVEFMATFRENGVVKQHHERSTFSKVGDAWYFVEGRMVPPPTRVNETPKVGRNDPCPCGSGKKFKKCCGH